MLTTRSNMNSLLNTFGPMRRDFQRALDQVGSSDVRLPGLCPISMWEDDQHFYIQADVPGMTHDEIDLQFEDGKLWIRGERKWHGDENSFRHNERTFGRFERAIVLSDLIDPTTIDARLEDGVLLVTFTRKPEAQPRSIEIRRGDSLTKQLSDKSSSD